MLLLLLLQLLSYLVLRLEFDRSRRVGRERVSGQLLRVSQRRSSEGLHRLLLRTALLLIRSLVGSLIRLLLLLLWRRQHNRLIAGRRSERELLQRLIQTLRLQQMRRSGRLLQVLSHELVLLQQVLRLRGTEVRLLLQLLSELIERADIGLARNRLLLRESLLRLRLSLRVPLLRDVMLLRLLLLLVGMMLLRLIVWHRSESLKLLSR